MLSSNAQGLYWIGRYLERAEHTCRLLADQFIALEDRPVEDVDRIWRRLYANLHRTPSVGNLESNLDDENYMLVDSYTLADDLTFAPLNPDSIRNCISTARSNARQVRTTIGRNMWQCINTIHLELQSMEIGDIWNNQPKSFYSGTKDAIHKFTGIANSTMYRDDGWRFLQLGKHIERAQLLSSLLDAQIDIFSTREPCDEPDWCSLLEVCESRLAYNRQHSIEYLPHRVIDFLVADPLLPHSIRFTLSQISVALEGITAQLSCREATHLCGKMSAYIDYDWPDHPADDEAILTALRRIHASCGHLHEIIEAAYFNYEIEDSPTS